MLGRSTSTTHSHRRQYSAASHGYSVLVGDLQAVHSVMVILYKVGDLQAVVNNDCYLIPVFLTMCVVSNDYVT